MQCYSSRSHNSNFDSRDKRVTFLVLFSVSTINIHERRRSKSNSKKVKESVRVSQSQHQKPKNMLLSNNIIGQMLLSVKLTQT